MLKGKCYRKETNVLKKNKDYINNYASLIWFIKNTKEIKTYGTFAKLLGITRESLRRRMHEGLPFTDQEIYTVKRSFNLSPEQIDLYFFDADLLKGK